MQTPLRIFHAIQAVWQAYSCAASPYFDDDDNKLDYDYMIVFHSITPLGIRPSLQRSQEDLTHPLQAGRDETNYSNEHNEST